MSSLLDAVPQREFLKSLLTWYKKSGRHDMAWREPFEPYRVLVSEFMLQQTTVSTVGPYFDRFIRRFPSIKSLSDANLNDVLALWSGLGYYARARNLWATSQEIMRSHRGRVPADYNALLKCPGIGDYIAGAVVTIAHNKPAPVLDGNIIRVLTRLLAIDEDPKSRPVQTILRKVSEELSLKAHRQMARSKGKKYAGPRALTLSLFDLGATVCTPRAPKCLVCPVAKLCEARKAGREEEIPFVAEKVDRPTLPVLHGIVESNKKYLVAQRPPEGLFGGLWEFPGFFASKDQEPVPYLESAFFEETGLKIRVYEGLPAFRHQLSHRIMVIRGFRAKINSGDGGMLKIKGKNYRKFKWVRFEGLSKLGISSITKRLMTEAVRPETG